MRRNDAAAAMSENRAPYPPGSLIAMVEPLVLAGFAVAEIVKALPDHKIYSIQSAARDCRHKHNCETPRLEGHKARAASAFPAVPIPMPEVISPVAEIRRLHFERRVPLTHIAALLHVPYRVVSAAISP